jgi:hypothetical protein
VNCTKRHKFCHRSIITIAPFLLGVVMLGFMAACSTTSAPAQPAMSPPVAPSGEHLAGIGSETIETVHGKIVSVDKAKMMVTIQGADGKTFPIHVYNPYNLAAAKPGGAFVARFYEIVTVRKKLPNEQIASASLQQGIISASPGQTPGGAAGSQLQIVATVSAINMVKNTVELTGPDGTVETVNVANPENLARVKVGEQLVITSTNVIAIALEKELPT